MKVLVVAATLYETRFLGEYFQIIEAEKASSLCEHNKIPVLVTGAGIISTTFYLSRFLQDYKPNVVINIGIAGAFNTQKAIAENFIIESDFILDSGILRMNDFVHLSDTEFSKDKNRLIHASFDLKKYLPQISPVKAQTVNLFYDVPLTNRPLPYRQYESDVESMEGAAVFFVSKQFGIPVCAVRSISNHIGIPSNKDNFEMAVKSNNNLLESLISQINEH